MIGTTAKKSTLGQDVLVRIIIQEINLRKGTVTLSIRAPETISIKREEVYRKENEKGKDPQHRSEIRPETSRTFPTVPGLEPDLPGAAGRIVTSFLSGTLRTFPRVPGLRADVREVVRAGVSKFIPVLKQAAADYEEKEWLAVQEGFHAIVRNITQQTLIRMELSEAEIRGMPDEALRRLAGVMAGAVRENRFIGVDFSVPPHDERRVRDLIALEKQNRNDPVKLIPSKDALRLYHAESSESFPWGQVQPSVVIRENFDSGKDGIEQLDSGVYGMSGEKIPPAHRVEAFMGGLLLAADAISQKTAKMITRDAVKNNLYRLAERAVLSPLARMAELFTSARRAASAA